MPMKKFEGNGLIKVGIEVVSLLILVVIKGSSEQVNQPAVCRSQLISSSFICLHIFWSYRRSVLAAWFGRSLTLPATEASAVATAFLAISEIITKHIPSVRCNILLALFGLHFISKFCHKVPKPWPGTLWNGNGAAISTRPSLEKKKKRLSKAFSPSPSKIVKKINFKKLIASYIFLLKAFDAKAFNFGFYKYWDYYSTISNVN